MLDSIICHMQQHFYFDNGNNICSSYLHRLSFISNALKNSKKRNSLNKNLKNI